MEPKAKKGKEETTDKIDVLRSTDKQSGESVEPVLKKNKWGTSVDNGGRWAPSNTRPQHGAQQCHVYSCRSRLFDHFCNMFAENADFHSYETRNRDCVHCT